MIGMVAHGMSFFHHSFYQIRAGLQIISHQKKSSRCLMLFPRRLRSLEYYHFHILHQRSDRGPFPPSGRHSKREIALSNRRRHWLQVVCLPVGRKVPSFPHFRQRQGQSAGEQWWKSGRWALPAQKHRTARKNRVTDWRIWRNNEVIKVPRFFINRYLKKIENMLN